MIFVCHHVKLWSHDSCVLSHQTSKSSFLYVIVSNFEVRFLCVIKADFEVMILVCYQVKLRSHDFCVLSHQTSKSWFMCVITSNFKITIIVCYEIKLRSNVLFVLSHQTSKSWFLCVIKSNFEVMVLVYYQIKLRSQGSCVLSNQTSKQQSREALKRDNLIWRVFEVELAPGRRPDCRRFNDQGHSECTLSRLKHTQIF